MTCHCSNTARYNGQCDHKPPPQKNRVYEMMTRVICGLYVVRVWSESDIFLGGPDSQVVDALEGVEYASDVAFALDQLEHVAAYEILDEDGNGALVYPDWK